MQQIYHWSDQEADAEAAGKDLHEFGSFKAGVIQIQDEYPEVFGNPSLSIRVAQMDEELVAAGDRRPYLTRYRACCEAVLSGNEVTAEGETINDDLRDMARSLQMGSEDEAAAALGKIMQSRDSQQLQSEETDSDVIEQMRRARHPQNAG